MSAAGAASPPLLDSWTSAVERLMTVRSGGNEPVIVEAVALLETGAERVLSEPVLVAEEFMSLCMELLEEHLPPSCRATKALLMLLANLCLTDENRLLAVNYGLPGTCTVLLQQHSELSAETLYYVFDLISTMTANDGHARYHMRPSIPYILTALREHAGALEMLFGGCFLLSTLAMLDSANCDVMVHRGGMQVLVDVYRHADEVLHPKAAATLVTWGQQQQRSASGSSSRVGSLWAQKQAERAQLCEGTKRWAREALLNVCRGCSEEVDLAQRLSALDFGVFGDRVPVDELKWELTATQKKRRPSAVPVPR